MHIMLICQDWGRTVVISAYHLETPVSLKNKKNDKIVSILPFLEEDEIHEMVVALLNDDENFKDLPLVAMMPFLAEEDCDALFVKALDGQYKDRFDLVALVPFVSEKCLSKLVDAYLEGKYADLELDDLYPFMSSKDVKRIFNFFLKKRKEEARN